MEISSRFPNPHYSKCDNFQPHQWPFKSSGLAALLQKSPTCMGRLRLWSDFRLPAHGLVTLDLFSLELGLVILDLFLYKDVYELDIASLAEGKIGRRQTKARLDIMPIIPSWYSSDDHSILVQLHNSPGWVLKIASSWASIATTGECSGDISDSACLSALCCVVSILVSF